MSERHEMPILEVELIVDSDEKLDGDVAQAIADVAGVALGSPASATWVRVRKLPREQYAENGGSLSKECRPVFVSVLKARMPSESELEHEITRLTEGIAAVCKRSVSNVHIVYLPAAAGRVAFGGSLVRA